MELFLLGSAAISAFVFAAAIVLAWSYYRRSSELRAALAEALARIEELEGRVTDRPAPFVRAPEIAPPAQNTGAPAAPQPTELVLPPPPPEVPPPRIETPALAGESFAPNRPGLTPGIAALASAGLAAAALVAARMDLISPPAGFVVAMLAGLGAFLAGEWLNAARGADAPPRALALLSALALLLFLFTSWFGAVALRVVSEDAGFFFAAAAALAALWLTRRYGEPMLAFALASSLALPAFFNLGESAAFPKLGFLIVVFVLAIWLSARVNRRLWIWLAAAGALGWAIAFTVSPLAPPTILALAAYLAALAAIAFAYAWSSAREPRPFSPTALGGLSEPLRAGWLLALAAHAILIALLLRAGESAPLAGAALAAVATGAVLAAAYAEAMALPALVIAASSTLALGFWPQASAPQAAWIAAAALAFTFTLSGWLAMGRAKNPTPGALLASTGALAALVASQARFPDALPRELWAGAALTLAALGALFHLRARGVRGQRGVAEAFALGAALAFATAIAFAAPGAAGTPALALAIVAITAVESRVRSHALRIAACIAAAAILWRIAIHLTAPAQPWPFALWLSPLALQALAAGAALLAAAHSASAQAQARTLAAQFLFAAATAAVAASASIEARHLATGGALQAPYANLAELGVHTLIALAAATALALRFGPRPPWIARAAEYAALTAAAFNALIAGGIFLNPWWGPFAAEAPGFLIANPLFIAYAAPAAAFFGYAWLAASQDRLVRANAAGLIALLLALLWAALEMRRFFHPDSIAQAPLPPGEAWSIAAVVFLLALTAALIVLYNRGLLPEAGRLRAMADPNLTPPR
ncbi:MAG: DUF2339 domain-containing protein [Hyphomonadaceae bacterium]